MELPRPLDWLAEKIAQNSQIPQHCVDPFTKEAWDYRRWVWWAFCNRFVVMNDPPTYGIIARPVSRDLWNTCPKGQELYVHNHAGDSIWVDFMWAPDQFDRVIEFLKISGKRWGGWEHRTTGKLHIVEISKLIQTSSLVAGYSS
jgi:hypothetical protein